jgi:hypothetical protein
MVHVSADDFRDRLVPLISLDEDALLERLADEVTLGVGPVDPSGKRAIARAWMDAQRQRLRRALCHKPQIETLRVSASSDSLNLAAAVADLIASITGTLPAATVAMLLVRTGLDRLCD